jgi:hypothetical protein
MAEGQPQLYAVLGHYEGLPTEVVSVHEDCEMADAWARYHSRRVHREAIRVDDSELIRKLATNRIYGPQDEPEDSLVYYVAPLPRTNAGAPPPTCDEDGEDDEDN